MIYQLVSDKDPILHKPTEKFDFTNPPMNPEELVTNMAETMMHHRGIGLAAPQCGIPYSVIVFGNPDDKDSIYGMFNPNIVFESDEKRIDTEGCLSFPSLYITMKRAKTIRVRYADMYGKVTTNNFADLTARVIQHEVDHLHGITFTKKANPAHLLKAKQQQKKRMRRR